MFAIELVSHTENVLDAMQEYEEQMIYSVRRAVYTTASSWGNCHSREMLPTYFLTFFFFLHIFYY